MAYQTIRYEVIDSVAILTLNRPEVANGFNIPMCEEILEAIRLAEGGCLRQNFTNSSTGFHFLRGWRFS